MRIAFYVILASLFLYMATQRANAEESPRWVWYTEYYQEQVASKSDEQLRKIKKSLKDLQRRLEQRQQRQQQAPISPKK